MGISFYLYGIIYIIHYCKALYDAITIDRNFVNKELDEAFPDKITSENVAELKEKQLNKLKKGTGGLAISVLTSIANLLWVIVGALYAVESTLFYILIGFFTLSTSSVIFFALVILIKNKDKLFNNIKEGNPKVGIASLLKDVGDTKIFNIIDRTARIGIASYIMYQHLFCQ